MTKLIEKLTECMQEVGTTKEYKGYWFKISDILTISICGLLCGLKTMIEIWRWANSKPAREMLCKRFKIRKIPSYAQFTNLLGIVNSDQLNEAFIKWCKYIIKDDVTGKTIAIDGKTVCSTEKMSKHENPLHIASAYISEIGITIGQLAVSNKSNEIPAVQELIQMINIKDAVVVADALNCQKRTAKLIIDGKGDYLLSVKENHPNLYKDISDIFQFRLNDKCEAKKNPIEKYRQNEKNRGRSETRIAYVIHDIDWLEGRWEWTNLQCVCAVRCICDYGNKTSDETRYYISSKKLSAKEVLKYSRNEWGVESMHWLLDVLFDEDKTRVMEFNLQKTLNILRKIILNLLRIYKAQTASKEPLVGIMNYCLFDPDVLCDVLNSLAKISNVTKVLQN